MLQRSRLTAFVAAAGTTALMAGLVVGVAGPGAASVSGTGAASGSGTGAASVSGTAGFAGPADRAAVREPVVLPDWPAGGRQPTCPDGSGPTFTDTGATSISALGTSNGGVAAPDVTVVVGTTSRVIQLRAQGLAPCSGMGAVQALARLTGPGIPADGVFTGVPFVPETPDPFAGTWTFTSQFSSDSPGILTFDWMLTKPRYAAFTLDAGNNLAGKTDYTGPWMVQGNLRTSRLAVLRAAFLTGIPANATVPPGTEGRLRGLLQLANGSTRIAGANLPVRLEAKVATDAGFVTVNRGVTDDQGRISLGFAPTGTSQARLVFDGDQTQKFAAPTGSDIATITVQAPSPPTPTPVPTNAPPLPTNAAPAPTNVAPTPAGPTDPVPPAAAARAPLSHTEATVSDGLRGLRARAITSAQATATVRAGVRAPADVPWPADGFAPTCSRATMGNDPVITFIDDTPPQVGTVGAPARGGVIPTAATVVVGPSGRSITIRGTASDPCSGVGSVLYTWAAQTPSAASVPLRLTMQRDSADPFDATISGVLAFNSRYPFILTPATVAAAPRWTSFGLDLFARLVPNTAVVGTARVSQPVTGGQRMSVLRQSSFSKPVARRAGSRTVLSAVLTYANGRMVPHRAVLATVQYKPSGASTWRRLGTVRTTNSGLATVTAALPVGVARFVFAGDNRLLTAPAASAYARIG